MTQRISGDRSLILTKDACKIAGLSQKHVQRLLRDKRIEGVKLGHDWLVYEDSLKEFMIQPRKRGPKGPRKKTPLQGSHNLLVDANAVDDDHGTKQVQK